MLTTDRAPWWVVALLAVAMWGAEELSERRPVEPAMSPGECWEWCGGGFASWSADTCTCHVSWDEPHPGSAR